MCDNDHILARENLGADGVVPERHDSIDSSLERLSLWQDLRRKKLIALIKGRVPFVREIKFWGRNVVRAAPLKDLLFTVLFSSLGLVESLQGTIVSLVEPPGLLKGDP